MHESNYISEVPITYRREFGQYFTPTLVARFMAKWVMKDDPKTILDPAFGLGIFYDEILKIKSNEKLKFVGYEIDKRIIDYLDSPNSLTNLKLVLGDYFEAELDFYDGIICNPPYMRFQKFLNRHDILPKLENQLGKKLVGYSNMASIFLVKALNELNN